MYTCGFFDSVQGDRKYNSRQMSQIFDGIITDGVFAHYGTHFEVKALGGMNINVGEGRLWFNHVWGLNDGNLKLTVEPSDTVQRIDALIVEIDNSDEVRNSFIKILRGGTTGAKPTLLDTDNFHQHALAYITVPARATAITQSNIQVVVGTSECPFATSVLESVNVDNLFDQWDAQFKEWFSGIQATMDDNIVTNLVQQIEDLRNEKADKSDIGTGEIKIGKASYIPKFALGDDISFYDISSYVNKIEILNENINMNKEIKTIYNGSIIGITDKYIIEASSIYDISTGKYRTIYEEFPNESISLYNTDGYYYPRNLYSADIFGMAYFSIGFPKYLLITRKPVTSPNYGWSDNYTNGNTATIGYMDLDTMQYHFYGITRNMWGDVNPRWHYLAENSDYIAFMYSNINRSYNYNANVASGANYPYINVIAKQSSDIVLYRQSASPNNKPPIYKMPDDINNMFAITECTMNYYYPAIDSSKSTLINFREMANIPASDITINSSNKTFSFKVSNSSLLYIDLLHITLDGININATHCNISEEYNEKDDTLVFSYDSSFSSQDLINRYGQILPLYRDENQSLYFFFKEFCYMDGSSSKYIMIKGNILVSKIGSSLKGKIYYADNPLNNYIGTYDNKNLFSDYAGHVYSIQFANNSIIKINQFVTPNLDFRINKIWSAASPLDSDLKSISGIYIRNVVLDRFYLSKEDTVQLNTISSGIVMVNFELMDYVYYPMVMSNMYIDSYDYLVTLYNTSYSGSTAYINAIVESNNTYSTFGKNCYFPYIYYPNVFAGFYALRIPGTKKELVSLFHYSLQTSGFCVVANDFNDAIEVFKKYYMEEIVFPVGYVKKLTDSQK